MRPGSLLSCLSLCISVPLCVLCGYVPLKRTAWIALAASHLRANCLECAAPTPSLLQFEPITNAFTVGVNAGVSNNSFSSKGMTRMSPRGTRGAERGASMINRTISRMINRMTSRMVSRMMKPTMNRIHRDRDQSGYSMTELLVVVAIIGIFSLITVPQFMSIYRSSVVKGSMRDYTSLMRKARQLAVTRNERTRIQFLVGTTGGTSFELDEGAPRTSLTPRPTSTRPRRPRPRAVWLRSTSSPTARPSMPRRAVNRRLSPERTTPSSCDRAGRTSLRTSSQSSLPRSAS